jgi:hypothetical protein
MEAARARHGRAGMNSPWTPLELVVETGVSTSWTVDELARARRGRRHGLAVESNANAPWSGADVEEERPEHDGQRNGSILTRHSSYCS